jgi:FAD:protein FMN transferase
MKHLTLITGGSLSLALCLGAAAFVLHPEQVHTFYHENVLGTSLELKVAAPSEEAAATAETAALAEIDRQAKVLSAYDPRSEFSEWFRSAGRPVPVSAELLEVFALFDRWRERTAGALDASAEAIVRVWKAATAQQRVPSQADLQDAVRSVAQTHWKLDAAAGTATHLSTTPLALNSFTKSYIAGHAADAALSAGATGVVVNIGGDVVVRGDHVEKVAIADPRADAENSDPLARLRIRDRAVATSGNYRRGFDIGGHHYSHIVDPRTGQPVDHILSATVVAKDPTDAGALATAMSVLTPAESRRLAESVPGAEYLLIQRDGNRIQSRGWQSYEIAAALPRPMLLAPAAAQAPAWNSAFELAIQLELARIDDSRARRPYVAVWIEDKDKFPVRTVALWYEKPRWLPDLRAWSHGDRLRSLAEGTEITATVSSATRPPGKYTLKWDGKDNEGKLVKPGRYTVSIEASREHGTYQIMRQEMDFTGVPKQVQLNGNTEIAGATLDYRKTASR